MSIYIYIYIYMSIYIHIIYINTSMIIIICSTHQFRRSIAIRGAVAMCCSKRTREKYQNIFYTSTVQQGSQYRSAFYPRR